jgi:hypothetical protein
MEDEDAQAALGVATVTAKKLSTLGSRPLSLISAVIGTTINLGARGVGAPA